MESALKLKLNEDLKQAMRDKNEIKVSTIRLLVSAIKYAELAKMTQFGDPDVIGIIAKEIKQRNESIEAYKAGNRPDLMEREQKELALLQAYMPAQASRDEIVAFIKQVIAETGAKGIQEKGKVMPKIMAQFKGKADGKEINNIVTELLGQ